MDYEKMTYPVVQRAYLPRPELRDLGDDTLARMYEDLKINSDHFYGPGRRIENPLKTTRYRGWEGCAPTESISVMYGETIDGFFGSKTISVRDTTEGTKRSSVTTLFDNDGSLLAVYESSHMTAIRCGLMAAMAMERCGLQNCSEVGLIGFGKVNVHVMGVLRGLFGIRNFVVYGRKGTPYLAVTIIQDGLDVNITNRSLQEFIIDQEVVNSATTNSDRRNLLGREKFKNTKLILTWDTGYMIGDWTRRQNHFSEYPEQLAAVKNIEFPFDESGLLFPRALTSLSEKDLNQENPVTVSFYGIGLADIIVAKHAYIKGL
jgi:hypothetical protein